MGVWTNLNTPITPLLTSWPAQLHRRTGARSGVNINAATQIIHDLSVEVKIDTQAFVIKLESVSTIGSSKELETTLNLISSDAWTMVANR